MPKENLKFINSEIENKNNKIRQEFFNSGAVLEDGSNNQEYYKLRKELEGLEGEKKIEKIWYIISHRAKIGNIKNTEEKLLNILQQDIEPKVEDFASRDKQWNEGSTKVVELGGEIVCLQRQEGDLYKGKEINLRDGVKKSFGAQETDKAIIVGFRYPFDDGSSNDYINVSFGNEHSGWIKEKEIEN